MRRKSISPTTIVLVILMLAALAGASRLVKEAPAAPPQEAKAAANDAPKPPPAATQAQEANERKAMMARMSAQKAQMAAANQKPGAPAPGVDPNTVTVDSKGFLSSDMGENGIKHTEEEIEKYKKAKSNAAPPKPMAMPAADMGSAPAGK